MAVPSKIYQNLSVFSYIFADMLKTTQPIVMKFLSDFDLTKIDLIWYEFQPYLFGSSSFLAFQKL